MTIDIEQAKLDLNNMDNRSQEYDYYSETFQKNYRRGLEMQQEIFERSNTVEWEEWKEKNG